MISLQIFLLGLIVVSTLTSLATEGIKKIFVKRNKTYYANSIAGLSSLFISILVGVGYVLITGLTFTAPIIMCIVALIFASWLCAMVGYDKVVQTINQVKNYGKGD